ncbi:uncharacterized protein EDB93DRAFT_1106270 [Suillus bovinus]|uniref:uncharacterized protein n=1 Tax=Suillus bovinus TaxID=48563 RepID=UPI001B860584|nr:uncharacterized protein EDB93DRAFT_1106270 [Suillus bovinus]KAG2138695.1 hypothetical protein EDB93DRAFT_1106270 [Suillus bovinus]
MGSNAFVKQLNFESNDLGIDFDLLLTFDDQSIPNIYQDYYPSAFVVRKFGADGHYRSSISFSSQSAFTKVDLSSGVIQYVTGVAMQPGQTTTLTEEGDAYHFSTPQTNPAVTNIQCINNAPSEEDIGFGSITVDWNTANTALVWLGVGQGQTVNVEEFKPILRGYICTDFKENTLIKSPIETDRLFEQNLAALEDNTTWNITYDPATGVFSIDQA